MIKEGSDFFQNAKFCPILDIYNSPDAWIANSMLSCSLSYPIYFEPTIQNQKLTKAETHLNKKKLFSFKKKKKISSMTRYINEEEQKKDGSV